MNQRELKTVLKRLDGAIDAYLETRTVATIVLVAGIFLFHLLMLAFTGAAGFVMTMALFTSLVAVGLVTGILFLHDRYGGDNRDQWLDVADIIESHLTGADVFNEWDDFLARQQMDPDIERVRQVCRALPRQYPPENPGEEISAEGLDVLLAIVKDLRAGVATRLYEEVLYWWYHRDDWREFRREATARRAQARKAREEAGLPTGSFASGPLRHLVHLRIVLTLLLLLVKALGWVLLFFVRVVFGFLGGAKDRRREKRQRQAEALVAREEEEYEYVEEYEEPPAEGPAPEAGVGTVKKVNVKKAPAPPPQPEVPAEAPGGKLSEARAIQKAMAAGLTAHDFDRKQEELSKLRGRPVSPNETLNALFKESRKSSKSAKSKHARTSAPSGMPRRIDVQAHAELRHRAARRQRAGRPRLMLHRLFVLLLVAAVPAAPFAAWRISDGALLEIEGDLAPPAITTGDEIVDMLRNPFESLFGNRSIELIDGLTLYVSAKDYERCIDPIGVPKRVTLEAERLYVGGFTVARITDIQYLDSPPMMIGVDAPPPEPAKPAPEPKPARRERERELDRAVIVNPK